MVPALLLAGWLVISGPPGRSGPAGPRAGATGVLPSLAQVWPGAAVVTVPAALPDGARFVPWWYADAATSVGVAPTPDGAAQRVVVRSGDAVLELRRVAQDRYPNFLAFTGSGDGSARRRVGGTDTSAAVADVALLDRFEPLLQQYGPAGAGGRRRLVLYDVVAGRATAVAADVRPVLTRHRILWWSAGDQQHGTWHSLDLAGLTP
jgi:hypothetical protein